MITQYIDLLTDCTEQKGLSELEEKPNEGIRIEAKVGKNRNFRKTAQRHERSIMADVYEQSSSVTGQRKWDTAIPERK